MSDDEQAIRDALAEESALNAEERMRVALLANVRQRRCRRSRLRIGWAVLAFGSAIALIDWGSELSGPAPMVDNRPSPDSLENVYSVFRTEKWIPDPDLSSGPPPVVTILNYESLRDAFPDRPWMVVEWAGGHGKRLVFLDEERGPI